MAGPIKGIVRSLAVDRGADTLKITLEGRNAPSREIPATGPAADFVIDGLAVELGTLVRWFSLCSCSVYVVVNAARAEFTPTDPNVHIALNRDAVDNITVID